MSMGTDTCSWGDAPAAVQLAEASGPTHPHAGRLPAVHGSAHLVEAVTERDIAGGGDGQVADLIADPTLEGRERLFPGSAIGSDAHVLHGRDQVKRHDVGGVHR